MKGSKWWAESVPDELGDGYTSAVLEAVRNGHAVIDWIEIEHGELRFEIMRAPLAIGEPGDFVFVLGLTAEAVDLIALALAERGEVVMSPTPALYDFAAEDVAQVQCGPHTLPELLGVPNGAAGMTKAAAKAHADALARDDLGGLMSAACKTYALHPYHGTADRIRDGYACEYGWRLPGAVGWGSRNSTGSGYVVQSAQWAHSYLHFWDYSMGAVFVRAASSAGDLREHVQGGALGALVAPFGPVPYLISPECREPLDGLLEPVPDTEPSPVSGADRPIIALGSKGADVAAWQRVLMVAGYALAPYGADGHFGPLTHNATVGFQHERGLPGNGIVCAATWGALYDEPVERPEPDGGITATTPCRNFTWANRKTVDNIVVHTIEAAEASTTADNTAAWGAGPSAPRASWHVAFDDDSSILCVPFEHVAWCAPGLNHNGIHFEHSGFARQSYDEWFDPFSRRMLARSAKLAAVLCKRYDIPVEFVDAAGLLRGERGITTHYQVTKGPGKGRTTHTDPGRGFPMSTYLDMIKEAMA
jgi:hypothetical protein